MGEGATVNGIDPSEVATGGNLSGGSGGVVTVVVEHEMSLSLMQVRSCQAFRLFYFEILRMHKVY